MCMIVIVKERGQKSEDLHKYFYDLTQWLHVFSRGRISDFVNSLPLILLDRKQAYLPLNLSQALAHTHGTLQSSTVTSRTPAPSLTLQQHVVQSVSAAAAPADCCYSAEYHRGCDGQHAEGDVNLATGVHHPTDATRGPEDPPGVWTVSHSVLQL